MTDTALLRSYMALRKITTQELAKIIGMSVASLSYKINNIREFKQSEILAIQVALGLTDEQRDSNFFTLNVDKTSTT